MLNSYLYISNTRGDIGASGNALKLDLSGALRQAGAASDMYLHHVNGDLYLGSVSAGGLLSIYNNNDLLAYNDESFISADTFDLDVDSHNIGASSDVLDVIMTGTGGLQMDAGNAWLNVRDTSLFTLDNTEVDNQFTLTSAGALDLQGSIKAKGLKLDVSGDITSGDGLAINVTNHTDLDAAGINLEEVTVQTGTASLYAQSGSLTLSDITTTSGLMSLLANGQMNLNGGVLTQTGNLVMDANRLVMDSLATINSAGDITATASDSMALFNLTANSGKVNLTTANNQNASLGAIVLTGLAAREAEITSQASITAGQMDIENTAVLNSGTFTTVNAVANSGDNFSITASDNISINGPLTSEQGSIILRGQKDLFVNRRLDASREVDVDVVGTLTLDAAQTIASGQKTTLKAASLQMSQGSQLDIEGDLILATSGDQVLAQLDIEGSLDADSSTGSIRFNERSDMAMAADIFAAGNVTIAEQQTLSTGSSLKVQSTALEMLAGSTLDAGTALNLINNTMSMGDGSLLKAAQDIQTQTSGSATFHQIESLQAVDLSAGDALTVNSTIDAGTTLSIDADGTLTLHKAVAAKDNIAIDAVGVATMNGLVTSAEGAFLFRGHSHLTINNTVSTKGSFTVTDAQTVSVAAGKDIISESAVAINAAAIQMGAGSKLDALSALTLTTTGNQKLATLDAGGDLKVESSTGWVAFDETVTTQGAADIDASGSLTLADNQNVNSSLGTDINANSVNFGDNSILNVDGSPNLSTVGQAELYTVDVEGSAALTHGGNLVINDRLDVVDSLTLDVGGDATFHGAVLVENALQADDIDGQLTVNDTLTVENDINITAGKDAEFNGVLTSNAGLLDIQGSGALTFNDDVSVNDSINLVITDGVSLAGGKTIASGGNTAIQSASVTMGDTARFDTGSDLIINTVGDQELATLDVDGNLDIDSANGHVELKEHVTVMNAVTIDALNGAVTLAENQQLYSGSDSTINAESLTFANGSVLEVDGALDVSTKADAELFKVDVASGALFTNGGSLTTNSDVLIGDNLTLDVAGDATFNKAVNVGNALLADDIDGKLTVNDTLTVENDINITAGKDAEFNGVLTSNAGLLDIQGSGALTFNDDVSVNDSINLVITDGVSLAGCKTIASGGNSAIQSASVTMGDTARFDTGSDLIINTVDDQELATLDVDGNLDIDSANGHVELKEHVTVMNAVTIDALNGAVTLAENQQLYSGSDSTINAESLTFANGSVLEVDGALDVSTKADAELFKVDVASGALFTNGGSLTTNSDVLIGDNLTLDVAGDATFNKAVNVGNALLADDIDGKLTVNDTLTVENDINITAGKDAEFNGVLTSNAGLLDIQGSGALTFNDDVSVNDSINLVITDGVSLTGGKTIASGGNTAIQSASVTMGDTARFDIGVDLTMDTSCNQELATLDVGGSLDVDSSAGALDFKEHVSVLGNTDLLVENAITLADDQKIESTGWIRSESDTFTMGDRSIIKSGESTSLFTDGDQDLATLDIGDDFTAASQQGAIHFNESVTVANDMNLLAAREITLAAQQAINAGSMAIGSETLLGADSFSIGEDAVIHTRELTLVHTRGDQLIGQLVSDAADSAFYLKTTEGSINGRSDLDIASGERHLKATQRVGCDAEGENCTGGQGQLMAATGIGDPLVIDLPWLSAETDNGDINILASSDLHARLLKATNGNIYMTALGYLEIEELIGTPWLLVNDFLFADRMTLDRGGLASRESVVVNQISMTDGGPLGVYAPTIDLTIDGGDATETLMAMGGFNETLSLTSDARSYYQNLEAAAFKPGSFANDVRVDINNTAQLHITDLLTQGGDLRMTGDLLIDSATVNTGQGYNMRMVTGYQTVDELSLNLNNSDGSALPVDGQFMTPYGEFWMSVDDVNVTTNAQFTRYNLPLLLTYKGSQDDLTTIGLPESFYRLSLEYQNEITNLTLEQITQGNPVAEQLSGDADPVSLSDSWVAANLPASEGNQAGSGNFDGDLEYEAEQSEEEEEYWLISEPGVEEES